MRQYYLSLIVLLICPAMTAGIKGSHISSYTSEKDRFTTIANAKHNAYDWRDHLYGNDTYSSYCDYVNHDADPKLNNLAERAHPLRNGDDNDHIVKQAEDIQEQARLFAAAGHLLAHQPCKHLLNTGSKLSSLTWDRDSAVWMHTTGKMLKTLDHAQQYVTQQNINQLKKKARGVVNQEVVDRKRTETEKHISSVQERFRKVKVHTSEAQPPRKQLSQCIYNVNDLTVDDIKKYNTAIDALSQLTVLLGQKEAVILKNQDTASPETDSHHAQSTQQSPHSAVQLRYITPEQPSVPTTYCYSL